MCVCLFLKKIIVSLHFYKEITNEKSQNEAKADYLFTPHYSYFFLKFRLHVFLVLFFPPLLSPPNPYFPLFSSSPTALLLSPYFPVLIFFFVFTLISLSSFLVNPFTYIFHFHSTVRSHTIPSPLPPFFHTIPPLPSSIFSVLLKDVHIILLSTITLFLFHPFLVFFLPISSKPYRHTQIIRSSSSQS